MEFDLSDLQLPERTREYLEELSEVVERYEVSSVQAYGSGVRGEVSESSDLDLLLVLEGNPDKEVIQQVEKEIADFERQFFDVSSRQYWFERAAGIFVWTQVTSQERLKKPVHHRIFGLPFFVDYFIADEVLLKGIFGQMKSIYGSELDIEWLGKLEPERHWPSQLFGSMFNSMLLAVPQPVYRIFSQRAVDYAMEAQKMSYYNCYALTTGNAPELEEATEIVPSFSGQKKLFFKAREDRLHRPYLFTLNALANIPLQHLWVLKRKII
ncbi:hypothetical protein GKQ38_03765 [Candidatus Nanohaloarchaea archaeon]|nr:hypothetical protein GKQ38_03765 [Candidatus Nanohaloarchaea archaeon]